MINQNYVFKKITYPGVPENRYIISENGIVVDTLNNKVISQYTDADGYKRCSLAGKSYGVHRLVAWDFCLKNRDMQLTVDHLDGKKENNYWKNLEWVTSSENTRRAVSMGLRNTRGENSSTNKYSQDFVESICVLLSKGYTIMDTFYKVTDRDRVKQKVDLTNKDDKSLYTLIYHLRHKEAWPDIVSKYEFPENISKSKKVFKPIEGKSRFTEDQVHQICKMYVDKKSTEEILNGLDIQTDDPLEKNKYLNAIRSITLGRNWTNISSMYFESRFGKCNRKKHNIDDDQLTEMLNKRYSRDYIQKTLNPEDDKLLRRAINKRIHNYLVLNDIKNYESFDLKDLNINI